MGLPRWRSGRESVCQCRDTRHTGSIPGPGTSPEGGNSNPLQLPGEFHGERSLADYLWGHKELDTTEQLSTQTF